MGQMRGKTGVVEMGVGEMGVIQANDTYTCILFKLSR